MQKRLIDIGVEAHSTSSAEFKSFIAGEIVKWSGIIKDAGIKPN